MPDLDQCRRNYLKDAWNDGTERTSTVKEAGWEVDRMCHLILFLPVFGLAVFLLWPLSMAGPVYTVIFVLSLLMYGLVIRVMRRPVVTGSEALIDSRARVVGANGDHWRVTIGNEFWDADASEPLQVGETVRVAAIDGLRLKVSRLSGSANTGPVK